MDVAFLALAESLVSWVEERFGRAAGFATAAVMVLVPIAAVVFALAWFTR